MSARLPIRWPCYRCDVDHETLAWTTVTPGLVVMRPAPDCPTGTDDGEEWWSVTHALSGQCLPGWFSGPEGAMAAAAHLADVWDWTRGDIPPLAGQIQATDVLRRFGAETDENDPPSMPAVERNPVFGEGDS